MYSTETYQLILIFSISLSLQLCTLELLSVSSSSFLSAEVNLTHRKVRVRGSYTDTCSPLKSNHKNKFYISIFKKRMLKNLVKLKTRISRICGMLLKFLTVRKTIFPAPLFCRTFISKPFFITSVLSVCYACMYVSM